MPLDLDYLNDELERDRVSLTRNDVTQFFARKRRPPRGESYVMGAPVDERGEHASLFVEGDKLVILVADEDRPEHTAARHKRKMTIDLRRLAGAFETHSLAFQETAERVFRANACLLAPEALAGTRLLVGTASLGDRQVPDGAFSRSTRRGLRIGIEGWLGNSRVVDGAEFLSGQIPLGILLGRHRRCWVARALVARREFGVLGLDARAIPGFVGALTPLMREGAKCIEGGGRLSVKRVTRELIATFLFWPEMLRRHGHVAFPAPRRADRAGLRMCRRLRPRSGR